VSAVQAALCPVCHHTQAQPLFDGGRQPLAALGWPQTAEEARAMPRYPLDVVQCPRCTHVWNRSFRYEVVPYRNNPNRMFNTGEVWGAHLAAMRAIVLERLPPRPVVIEIGCGEGHFLRGLAQARGAGRYVGFDPNTSAETGCGLEFFARTLDPMEDLAAIRPDAIVIRHVLEHLPDPAAVVEQLAWAAAAMDKPARLFAEVPCIDRVFQTDRLADFFYEHPSNFTTASFAALMARAGEVERLAHGYDGEVVFALARLGVPAAMRTQAATAAAFARRARDSQTRIGAQIRQLAASGKRLAIWGGTGKGAAFMHHFAVDARMLPVVVDSDPAKAGSYVPGVGQAIVFRDELKRRPADVIIIPNPWRARDILAEMAREGIAAATVLIEHDGALVDFFTASHPYR
jgi:SAM-dependent methyltransferase